MNRQQFNKVIVPGLFSFAKDSFSPKSGEGELWRQFVEAWGSVRTNSQRSYEESAYYAGLGNFAYKEEGVAISYDEMVQGPTKRWIHKTYGLGVRITEELIEDTLSPYELPTEMEDFSRELGSSAKETLTLLAFDIVNSGTVTTTHTAGDGLAIFSATHTRLRGGTWSNLLAPAADLSASSLQSALDAFENTRDDTGKIQNIKANNILVNPSNAWKAKELLNSAYDPESPNNAVNSLKERNLQLMSTSYYTDTDAFTLMTKPPIASGGVICFMRRPVRFAQDGDFDTGDAKFKSTFRHSIEVNKPNNIFHSAGA